ncbi:MAG: glucose sorbosone dehydrogenase, partial [Micrococcaceae bacterium]|nr:glucose sorbosone dehydrogenase [Micrococcaceae bacterium]
MSAAARRRPARSPSRAILPALALLVLTGCSPEAAEPEPVFAGASAASSPVAGATAAVPPALSYEGDAVSGLGLPWSIVVLDDGSLLVSERDTGEIRRINGTTREVIGTIADATGA